MQTPFSFDLIISFGLLSVFLLFGLILRANIGFFQNYLIPSSLIGGFSGLVILNTLPVTLNLELFEAITYHLFSVSFISVGLTAFAGAGKKQKDTSPTVRGVARGVLWGGLIEGITLAVQSLVGCSLVFGFVFVGYDLFPTFGLFAPLGFTQGATIGLIFATMGFLFAFFVGVPMVSWGIRKIKGEAKRTAPPQEILKGYFIKGSQKESAGYQTTHSANIDSLAFQTGLVGAVYLLTYGFVTLLNLPFSESISRMNWGFVFFYGLLTALAVGWVMKKTGANLLIDQTVQKRITGWSIDFLIVSTIFAIKPAIVVKFIIPILVVGMSSGVATTIVIVFFGKRLSEYNLERMVLLYGTCTGTLSSGLLLLRIVDPKLDSPVALEAGVLAIGALPFVLASMLLVNAKFLFGWEIWHIMAAFALMLLFNITVLKVTGLWGKRRF